MPANYGIWIDHKSAIVVHLEDHTYTVTRIASEAERKHRATGGVRGQQPFVHRSVNSGARDEAHRRNDWQRHYERVIQALPIDASVYVLGSGQAKAEFVGYLKRHGPPTIEVMGVEATPRLTQGQLIARIKTAFGVETRILQLSAIPNRRAAPQPMA
jgi:hypothetical protein